MVDSKLAGGLSVSGLSAEATTVVVAGALAGAGGSRGLMDAISNLLAFQSNETLTIDPVSSDNAIGGREISEGLKLSGQGVPGSQVQVSWGGISQSVDVDAEGHWAVTLDSGAEGRPYDGASTIRVTQGEEVATRPVYLDTTPPEAPVNGLSSYLGGEGDPISLPGASDPLFNLRPAFVVGEHLQEQPRLLVNGEPVAATYDSVTGTLTPDEPLPVGDHEIAWSLVDAVGNAGESSPAITLRLDGRAITAYNDDSDEYRPSSTAEVTGDTTPGFIISSSYLHNTTGPELVLYVDGVAVEATRGWASGGFSLTPNEPLGVGDHSITWAEVQEDVTGEQSLAFTITVTDMLAPRYIDDVPAYVSGPEGQTTALTNDSLPQFLVGTGHATDPILYNGDTEVAATYDATAGTLTPNAPLAEGSYEFSYGVATDSGEERSLVRTVTIDLTPPDFTPSGAPYEYLDRTGPVTGYTTASVTDESKPFFWIAGTPPSSQVGNPVLLVDGNVASGGGYQYTGGEMGISINVPLTPGAHQISWTAMDKAGNLATTSSPAFSLTYEPAPDPEPSGMSVGPTLFSASSAVSEAISLADPVTLASLVGGAEAGSVAGLASTSSSAGLAIAEAVSSLLEQTNLYGA